MARGGLPPAGHWAQLPAWAACLLCLTGTHQQAVMAGGARRQGQIPCLGRTRRGPNRHTTWGAQRGWGEPGNASESVTAPLDQPVNLTATSWV
jgi:hypothetical protein